MTSKRDVLTFANAGETVGTLSLDLETNTFNFEGNTEKSAQELFDLVIHQLNQQFSGENNEQSSGSID